MAYLFLSDSVIEKIVVEVQPLPFGADRDAGDHGNLVPPIDMMMNRSLTHWRPSFDDMGNEQKAGFIDKH